MYVLTIEDYISAAHQLKGYKGKCENIHGHNWKVEVSVYGQKLNDIGILIDFHDLKDMLKEVLQEFDHKNLNDIDEFTHQNPSSELLSKIIYQKIEKLLKQYSKKHSTNINVLSVTVWESASCRSTYQKKFF
ncbi:MAG: 6-carboxytetrahydropterin synthase QueD [Spirochaetota bacterium]